MMLLTALFVAATPPAAPQLPVSPAVAAPAPQQVKERKICRDDPAFTGTRITKQICLTKSQWKSREAALAAEGASN